MTEAAPVDGKTVAAAAVDGTAVAEAGADWLLDWMLDAIDHSYDYFVLNYWENYALYGKL